MDPFTRGGSYWRLRLQHIFCNYSDLIKIFLSYNQRVHHPDYNNELTQFLPRTVVLKKPPGAQLGFNIRGGKASQLGIFISKVSLPIITLFIYVSAKELTLSSWFCSKCFDRWCQIQMLIGQDCKRAIRSFLSMTWTFKTLSIQR